MQTRLMKDNPSLVADGSRITETGKAKKRKERPKREKDPAERRRPALIETFRHFD